MTITKNLKRKGKKKGKLPETIIVLKQRKNSETEGGREWKAYRGKGKRCSVSELEKGSE